MSFGKRIALLACCVSLVFTSPLILAGQGTWTVVVAGLDNPRGLAFGPEGALYIAQASLRTPVSGFTRAM